MVSMKSKRESNLDYHKKLKEQGSKAISIVLSSSEFELLKSYMDVHSMSSYREVLMSAVSYRFSSFCDVIQVPFSELQSLDSLESDSQFVHNGKAYRSIGFESKRLFRDVETGEVFTRTR